MKLIPQLLLAAMVAITVPALAAPALLNTSVMPVQERKVSNFKGVAVSGSINAFIKMGNEEGIRLEGDEDAIAELITEVKSGVLIIRPKTKWVEWNKKFNNSTVTVYITAKNLTSVTLSGSGSVEVQNSVSADEFAATLSGSGNIKLAAHVNAFTAVISGSGNIIISGKANDASMIINGSGSFKGTSFTVETASTKISGSGSIYVTVHKKINALTAGSGTVYYKGNPTVQKKTVGSGDVRQM